MVPRVPWNPSFMKVLIILYYDKLTRSVGPVDYNSFNGTLYLMNSKIILTVAHLQVLWSEFWSPRAQQTTQNTPFRSRVGVANVKVGVAKIVREAYAQNPPLQNPKSATGTICKFIDIHSVPKPPLLEMFQVPDNFELLYKSDGHYDSIMALSGGLSTVRQSLQNAYYDCTDVVIK